MLDVEIVVAVRVRLGSTSAPVRTGPLPPSTAANAITSAPPCLYAAESRISGTTERRNAFSAAIPTGVPAGQAPAPADVDDVVAVLVGEAAVVGAPVLEVEVEIKVDVELELDIELDVVLEVEVVTSGVLVLAAAVAVDSATLSLAPALVAASAHSPGAM